jgi:hypothetical protein
MYNLEKKKHAEFLSRRGTNEEQQSETKLTDPAVYWLQTFNTVKPLSPSSCLDTQRKFEE